MSKIGTEISSPASMTAVRPSLVSKSENAKNLSNLRAHLRQHGPGALADHELIALCVEANRHEDALQRAVGHLESGGSLHALSRLSVQGLRNHTGLTERQVSRLLSAFELGRRVLLDRTRSFSHRPLSQQEVETWARCRLVPLEHEEVWVLCVDGQSRLQSAFQVGRGGVHGCALLPRDILTPVVRDAACGFVLVHNHPSGDPRPSQEDIALTQSVAAAAQELAIPLLDHVIVARNGARSLFEMGLLRSD